MKLKTVLISNFYRSIDPTPATAYSGPNPATVRPGHPTATDG